MLQNAKVRAFTVSELLRENQQSGWNTPLHPPSPWPDSKCRYPHSYDLKRDAGDFKLYNLVLSKKKHIFVQKKKKRLINIAHGHCFDVTLADFE